MSALPARCLVGSEVTNKYIYNSPRSRRNKSRVDPYFGTLTEISYFRCFCVVYTAMQLFKCSSVNSGQLLHP